MKRQFNAELFVIVWKGNLIRRCLSLSGFGDTRYIIDIMILRAHGIYSIWRNMAHVGLKDRFELPHFVARLFNVVKILGSAVTAVRSVVNIVYDFVVGGNVKFQPGLSSCYTLTRCRVVNAYISTIYQLFRL